MSTRFAQLGYTIDGLLPKRTATSVASDVATLRLVDSTEYYTRRGVSVDSQLELPDRIEALLDRYFALRPEEQAGVQRWCHWLNHAAQVWRLSPSAAHIATVQAVEALMPSAKSADRCGACGQSLGPGPTQRFADFLDRYASGPDREQGRKDLYALRSSLSHGGKLLSGELAGDAFHDFTPQTWEQRQLLDTTRTLARVAGVDWLLQRDASSSV